MSTQDKVAKRLLQKYGHVLNRTGQSGWWTDIKSTVENSDKEVMESAGTKVKFANKAKLVCEIVGDEKSKTVGLQKYASMPDGYGMLFPFENETVRFHMGTVPFSIDMIFVGSDNRVNKIIPYIEPGTRGNWGMAHVSAVIEANAGFCDKHKIVVGDKVDWQMEKTAQGLPTQIGPFKLVKQYEEDDEYIVMYESRDRGYLEAVSFSKLADIPSTWQAHYASWDPTQRVRDGFIGEFDSIDDAEAAVINYINMGNDQAGQPTFQAPRKLMNEKQAQRMPLFNTGDFVSVINQPGTVLQVQKAAYNPQAETFEYICNIVESVEYQGGSRIKKREELLQKVDNYTTQEDPAGTYKMHQAQEFYPREPRKDLNPKMVEPSLISPQDRFRDRDLIDVQTQNQPMGNEFDMTIGYDPTKTDDLEDEVGPVRPSP
jgi:uncharacterized membrane protein (UPF0127 family)